MNELELSWKMLTDWFVFLIRGGLFKMKRRDLIKCWRMSVSFVAQLLSIIFTFVTSSIKLRQTNSDGIYEFFAHLLESLVDKYIRKLAGNKSSLYPEEWAKLLNMIRLDTIVGVFKSICNKSLKIILCISVTVEIICRIS